ncbi:MAG: hydrogenase maturation protease [Ferruginibacter sp.]
MTQQRILIMGVGNYLMRDEGVGVHAIKYLEKQTLPANVDLLDGGTGGFHLLGYFERYPHVILVDATLDNNPPGSIRLIKPRYAADFPQAMSTHDIGLKDLVSAMQLLDVKTTVYLFTISIKTIQEQGIELNAEVKAILPELAGRVIKLCNEIV